MIQIQSLEDDRSIFEFGYGDIVYDIYGSPVRVIGDKYYPKTMLYRLHYTDGRSSLHSLDEMIYTRKGKFPIKGLIQNFIPLEVDFFPIKYKHIIGRNLEPDAYVSGMFLTYGNSDDPHINLPIRLNRSNFYLSDKYQMDYGMKMKGNLAFFSYMYSDEIITWKDFFFDKLKEDTLKYHHIPIYIRRSSINDRWQYIRGAFDIGYQLDIFLESECGIGHTERSRLEEVQLLLWSLGINSTIEKVNWLNKNHFKFRLLINEDSSTFGRFFYNTKLIERMLVNRYSRIKYPPPVNPVRLSHISVEGEFPHRELILEKPSVYIQTNFLPRVSL